jgi:hypothetical protein
MSQHLHFTNVWNVLEFFSVFSVIQAPLRIGLTALKFFPGGKIRRNRVPHHYTSTSTLKNHDYITTR